MTEKVINVKKVRLTENRKKIYFVFQLLVFISLAFLLFNYPNFLNNYGLSVFYLRVISFYLMANLIVSIARIVLVSLYIKRNNLQNDYKDNFIIGVDRIASMISIITVLAAILYLFRVDPVKLFATLSILAAALAFLFKDYIINLINGMIIMFSDQLSLNDYVKIGEYKGRIVDINLITLMIRTDEGVLIYIPNNVVFSRDVINYSKSNMSIAVIEFDLDKSHFGKIKEMELYLIEKISARFEDYVSADNINLKIIKIKKDEVEIKLLIRLKSYNAKIVSLVKKFALHLILEYLDEVGKKREIVKEIEKQN